MGIKVEGIVVAFNELVGVALIRHKSYSNLSSLARAYQQSASDETFWFAKFQWSSVLPANKLKIIKLQARFSNDRLVQSKQPDKHARQDSSTPISIKDIIRGCPLNCQVEKTPKWEAFAVSISVNGLRFGLPERRYELSIGDPTKRLQHVRMSDRAAAKLSRSVGSNKRRPWGGMSQ